ncbi:hypothetical protein OG978_32475 [Streptomyces sp. NBC_01591]|uniref:hypothetical protein n=1 Tax=Streptomyces sp. NBC_01591 TaxID=2975888 RepID=UPI002DD838A0|nr:hypothetical protein [Streptomyces sp. NBC_01591]WSD71690.1 hypothetical protein OG978_32475 [Streptomyces sp. NBC_01591]
MTTTPADVLRAAAEKLRVLAAAVSAPEARYQPFHADGTDVTQGRSPGMYDVAKTETVELADYIAVLHPGIGLALADWLETTAGYYAPGPTHPTHVVHALAVARQILGTTTETRATVADMQPETVAHPATTAWTVEYKIDDDTTWYYLGTYSREGADFMVRDLANRDTETRLVRATTTYTVEPAPAVTEEPEFAGPRQCGHDDYHDAHEWADLPHIWCPGHSLAEEPGR